MVLSASAEMPKIHVWDAMQIVAVDPSTRRGRWQGHDHRDGAGQSALRAARHVARSRKSIRSSRKALRWHFALCRRRVAERDLLRRVISAHERRGRCDRYRRRSLYGAHRLRPDQPDREQLRRLLRVASRGCEALAIRLAREGRELSGMLSDRRTREALPGSARSRVTGALEGVTVLKIRGAISRAEACKLASGGSSPNDRDRARALWPTHRALNGISTMSSEHHLRI